MSNSMATASESTLVLVTGASGYIATHVIKQLQEAGYKVRGTVRNLNDETKIKHLHNICPDAKHKLELVEADLTKPDSWEAALKDIEYVMHVASPFPNSTPKNENEVIQPAVEGTHHILKACVAAKSVKRVVLTSSCVAVAWNIPGQQNLDKVFTEEDWSDADKMDAYAKSKTLAEKAAWDFVKELSEEDRIELAVVNPGYVMGPVLHGTQCTSMEIVKRLLERSMPAVPKLNLPIVDVRDVAAAHIKAMVLPEAAGNRHLAVNKNLWMKDVSVTLTKEFKPQGYNVPTMVCPYFALWMTSLFDKTVKFILPQIGKVVTFDNTRMKDVLGITPREAKDTVIDMAYSMIESGFIKKTKKYKGPHSAQAEAEEKKEEAKEAKEENKEDKKEETVEDEKKKEENVEDKKEEKKIEDDKKEGEQIGDMKTDATKTDPSTDEKTDKKPAETNPVITEGQDIKEETQ